MANSSSVQGCQFRDPQSVHDLTCSTDRIVRLSFNNSDVCALYAHPAFLCAWSGVLRNVSEDVQEEVVTPGRSKPSSQGAAAFVDIPLDDSDTAAWEDALALMHPSRQLFRMTWDKAARLLLLAHKYDMPAITGETWQWFSCSMFKYVACMLIYECVLFWALDMLSQQGSSVGGCWRVRCCACKA